MKKRIIILAITLALLISISFVSAGLSNDFWNKITGKVVEENVTEENTTEECSSLAISMWCPDETTLCPMTTDEQRCSVWDCDSCEIPEPETCAAEININFDKSNYVVGEHFEVEIGVFDSQGNPLPNYIFYVKTYDDRWHTPNQDRTGADGYFKHTGTIEKLPNGVTKVILNVYTEETSSCSRIEDTTEIEVEPGPEPPRPEPRPPEPEPRPEICAAKISINFDKEVYYIGDPFEVVMEVFDVQGNLISNYPFFIAMYRNEMWDTFTDGRTDERGYSIHEERMNTDDPLQLGENKFKIYTEAYTNCNSVEDITVIEIRERQKGEEVCGIGTCVPEEGGEVEEIPEGEILYSCTGCELESKCYPIGYRKSGQYCTPNNNFVNQIEEGMCDNHFECKTNICVSDECVGEGLIKRILNWLKKFFGGEEEEEGPKPEVDCSKLLIEKNIGKYDYGESGYGDSKEAQAPLYSEDGEQLGSLKCCSAQYLYEGKHGGMAMVCPYDSRGDVKNALKWLSARGELSLGEYKDEQLYKIGGPVIVWIHKQLAIAVGGGEGPEPELNVPLPEDVADAYLKKYKNDLEDIEIPEPEPVIDQAKEFLEEAERLGGLTLIDFEALPDGTVLQADEKLTGKEWESLGVTFETPSEDYLKVFGPWYPFNPLDKLSLSPGFGPFESGSDTHDDLNIIFTEPVKAAGVYLLDLGDTDERESITFLDANNNVIEKISPWPKSTFGNPAPGTFVSLVYDGISKIEIKENTQDGDDIAYDNLYFVR